MQARRHEPAAPPALPPEFFARPVEVVARELLGRHLVVRRGRSLIGGRIVEVEAYGGPGDPGSHADRSPDGRAAIMFGPPARLYVYFTYGMHHCMNVVTGADGEASAVLLRALEPVWGVAAMRSRTPASLPEHLLCAGPGRICRALGIDRAHNGRALGRSAVAFLDGSPAPDVVTGPRIGLTRDDGRPWRFLTPSRSLSRPWRGSPSRDR